jgi:hypothetical protein
MLASLRDGSRKELVHTRADKDLLGRIRTVAFQEPPGKSGGRGAGVRERCCERSPHGSSTTVIVW